MEKYLLLRILIHFKINECTALHTFLVSHALLHPLPKLPPLASTPPPPAHTRTCGLGRVSPSSTLSHSTAAVRVTPAHRRHTSAACALQRRIEGGRRQASGWEKQLLGVYEEGRRRRRQAGSSDGGSTEFGADAFRFAYSIAGAHRCF